MVGFKWKRTVVTAFACASLAWAQSTQTPSAPTVEKPRTITVQELGKAPDRCRVVRTWRESNGMEVFEVQSVATGERLTIVQSGKVATPGGKTESMATRIYHWSGANPPAGAPMAPQSAVASTPAAKPAAVATTPSAKPVPVAAAPAAKPAVATVKPVVKNTPVPVPLANLPVATVKPASAERSKPAPVAAADVKLAQLTNTNDTTKAQRPQPAVQVEQAQPSDWHKSWGKAADAKTKLPAVSELPRADVSRPDPLKEPQSYTRHAQDERGTSATVAPKQLEALPKNEKITLAPQQPATVKPSSPAPSKATETKVASTAVDCNTTAVPCVECPPKFSLFRRATPCVTCQKEECACQPATPATPVAPVAEGPPKHAEPIEIVKSGNSLVDVVKRLRSNPPGMPTAWTPMDRGATFEDKLQNALAESKARREARAELAASRKASTVSADGMVAKSDVVIKPNVKSTGSQPMGAATEGMPPATMPVPVMIIPPVRNPQALHPTKKQAPPTETVSIPRSEIENAFTDMPSPKEAAIKVKQSAPENDEVNAFSEPPDSTADGGFAVAMRNTAQQYAGINPGYGYAPRGAGMYPYGFNQGAAYAARPPVMVPGHVYVNDVSERMPASDRRSADRNASQPAVDVQQMLTLLKSALYPSHREWAADNLALVDYRQNPQVVEALVKAAKEDAASTVRAGCVRGLGTMHANTPVVLATLQSLKTDTAPQVVQEADRVLAELGAK